MYKHLNVNPKNKKVSDCVVRSFSVALNQTWEKTFKELAELALKNYAMPNDKIIYSKYAESKGFKSCKVKLTNGHKPTVKEFAVDNPHGTYILRVANHVVCVMDGFYIDSWDSGYKSVYMFWELT